MTSFSLGPFHDRTHFCLIFASTVSISTVTLTLLPVLHVQVWVILEDLEASGPFACWLWFTVSSSGKGLSPPCCSMCLVLCHFMLNIVLRCSEGCTAVGKHLPFGQAGGAWWVNVTCGWAQRGPSCKAFSQWTQFPIDITCCGSGIKHSAFTGTWALSTHPTQGISVYVTGQPLAFQTLGELVQLWQFVRIWKVLSSL